MPEPYNLLKNPWLPSTEGTLRNPVKPSRAAALKQFLSDDVAVTLSSSQGSGFIFGLPWRLFLPFVGRGGSSWAQHEPAALTLRAGTSRQQPAGRPPSSSRTGEPAWSALNICNKFLPGC
ncbi:mucin-5AC isoform X1 [Lates japonicus]|uniref:Mucin-5AC isoform X1 n=1 Tax=Lates japonicus TaxID=270547 RepID=A0AAD3MXV9_LATJO|nr:mucin-5AC isoform X1 [Lates japonicus]